MKKIFLFVTILITSIVLVSCTKKGDHNIENINSIEVYKIDNTLYYKVSSTDQDQFIKDLNSLEYKNHSGTLEDEITFYILINYSKFSTKVDNLNTVRIKDGNITRNRNRQYNINEYLDLINKFNK